uniref:Protein stum n=1 Tax=Anopheles farauti TaxID=69004 RepID=A0A182QL91_9DIPT
MYHQHDGRTSSSTARGASAASTVQPRHHRPPPSHRGFLGSYGSSSTPSSSLENQRSFDAQHSASTSGTTGTATSLFGDPVLPATRHADLLGGEDLYQNLKNNIELYHAKLYNEQERQRQAERDALFEQYANGTTAVGGGGGGGYRTVSAVGGGRGGGSGSVKPIGGNSVTMYNEPPASRSFARTQSAGLGVDMSNSRSNIFDMDLLKQNDWIDFSEHEYQHSLIPTSSRTVADVQQFTGGNITRRIENGVFQNPRAAAAARASRRNSITDASAYGMMRTGGGGMGPMELMGDNLNGTATFTVLGHGPPVPEGYEEGESGLGESEYERMLRYGRTDPSTAIIRDKINTGSNFRVSDARQHKNTAFTIINEVLPKSSSFDLAGGNRYSPYRDKHRLAASRILSASSATHGASSVGFYGYGYGPSGELTEDGASTIVGHRRRFSSSELSLSTIGARGKETEGRPSTTKRPTKSKTSLSLASNPGRRQRGVLEVISGKKSKTVPSAKVTITQPSEDGRSLTPTPSESGLSGTGTGTGTDGDRMSIPEHQLKNLKLFGYKPFSSRPTLSPVPDKSSMESSQADLRKQDGSGSGGGKKGGGFRAPVFNIRGLLMSPRSRDKSKEPSPESGHEQGKDGAVIEQQPRAHSKEPAAGKQEQQEAPQASPPKKRRFNLARAIIESARKGGSTEPEVQKVQKVPAAKTAAQEEDGGEKRKLALKMKLGIVRSGVRKDSEGNGVKEKKADKGKGKTVGSKGKTPARGSAKSGKKKGPAGIGAKKGSRYDEDEDDEDDYYRRRDRDEGSKRTKKGTGGTGGGGMLKSALNYAASFRTRGERVATAGPGGRRKPGAEDAPKGAKRGAVGQRAGGKDAGDKIATPNARRRDKSAKGAQETSRGKAGGGAGGAASGRVKSGKMAGGRMDAGSRAKSAAGARGKQLRRSSSAVALDPGQLRRANKLYEKNQKGSTGGGGSMGAGMGGRGGKSSSSLIQSKANRQSNNDLVGMGLSKSDSRGEMRTKAGDGGGPPSGSKDQIEKRDSERSLKKSDSNKSLATMGGKPKKSDSKSSLLNKRSDSRSSLHQTAAAEGAGVDGVGAEALSGKSPLNSVTEGAMVAPEGGVKSARPTPKLQSKGSLLSLISLKGSKRNLDRGGGGEAGQRPDTATTVATALDGGPMPSSTRLQSASVRNAPGTAGAGPDGTTEDMVGSRASGMNEKPTSTKPLRRMMSRGSLLSIKSIAHARSFTNIRPPTGGDASKTAGDGAMPPQTMTKVTEGSQEHDDTTDTETSHGGGGGGGGDGSMGVATHELTVAGDGEGEKVSNEYNGESHRMKSPMVDRSRSPAGMDNVSSANTESMRDRTMGMDGGDGGGGGGGGGASSNSDEFDEDEQVKCSKCCCACCAPCWTRTCLPFKRCFRGCSSCCRAGGGGGRLGKRKADGQLANEPKPKGDEPRLSCWQRLLGCCRRCRNSKTAPESTAIVQRGTAQEAKQKTSCWQSLNCCASCRRNKSRELVPRSSIDSDPPADDQSRCRTCWSRLLCCCRPKGSSDGGKKVTHVKRHRMEEPVEMETVKCCFCFKRQRPKVKAKPKKKVPVKSTFNCFSCCMMCCKKKSDNQSRRTSNLSKKQSIAPTIPPEDLRPKIDMSLVEHSSLMRGAIPVLPICLAYFCLLLNVVIPGSGTVLSGGLCLCIGKPRFSQHDSIKGRIGSFIINCIVGVSQCFTIIFCVVGWGWAIWWGTIMLRLAKQHRKILEMEAAQEEGEEQTTLSNRTGASNPPVALVSKTHRDVETGR